MNTFDLLEDIRRKGPVVHHITNWVTIYDCAQVVKTLGASPVMAHAPDEAADMVAIASSLVLNIGTLTRKVVAAMALAAAAAGRKGIPVVLDVCGAGATPFRNDMVAELLAAAPITIIKGNASEIASLAGASVRTKGVDSGDVDGDIAALAQKLAAVRAATVVVTGKVDIVADAGRVRRVANGDAMMTTVVGTGCMAASVIGTFAAVATDMVDAAASALCCYGIAAELAAAEASAPVAFKAALLDRLYTLDRATVDARSAIS